MNQLYGILHRAESDWRETAPPLREDRINDLMSRIGLPLPESLINLYRLCDGGEGSLPFEPWNFVLWDLENVASLREHSHYRKYYNQYLLFGGNGGGEYVGFDAKLGVFMMDPIAGEESIRILSPSFDSFIQSVGSQGRVG